jgi:hypothetical protein
MQLLVLESAPTTPLADAVSSHSAAGAAGALSCGSRHRCARNRWQPASNPPTGPADRQTQMSFGTNIPLNSGRPPKRSITRRARRTSQGDDTCQRECGVLRVCRGAQKPASGGYEVTQGSASQTVWQMQVAGQYQYRDREFQPSIQESNGGKQHKLFRASLQLFCIP